MGMIRIDMEMPKSCKECMFNEYGLCSLLPRVPSLVDVDKYTTRRSVHCPLIETEDVPDANVGKWVSVKDGLPPAHEFVIVSITDDRGDSYYRYTDTGWYLHEGKCWIVDNEATINVDAWMPLPKPYEPPKEE